MGSHLDQGEDEALSRLSSSLRSILDQTDALGYDVGIALETTAGQGTGLGWRFEQLTRIMNDVGAHRRLGVCLDTCHVFVAGYDLRTEETYESTWKAFDQAIGYDRLKVIHANDAKKPLGSRVDRHEHIGFGEIGIEAFARLMTDKRIQHVPVIVETPESEEMHSVNVGRLRHLARGGEPYTNISVKAYGHYSDWVRSDGVELKLICGSTVGDALKLLAATDSRFSDVSARCRFALQDEFCDESATVNEGDVISLLPPVSGG